MDVFNNLERTAQAVDSFISDQAILTSDKSAPYVTITFKPILLTDVQFGKNVVVNATPGPVYISKVDLAKINTAFKQAKPELAAAFNSTQ
jgi:hypothetical protein